MRAGAELPAETLRVRRFTPAHILLILESRRPFGGRDRGDFDLAVRMDQDGTVRLNLDANAIHFHCDIAKMFAERNLFCFTALRRQGCFPYLAWIDGRRH